MKARRLYQSVLRQRPRLASARYGKALLELESGQLDTGIRELQKLLALEPNHVDGLIGLGKALARVGNTVGANDNLSKAIACDAARIEPYLELSKVHLRARLPTCRGGVEKRARRDFHRSATYNQSCRRSGRHADEAVAILRAALLSHPADPLVYFRLGDALRETGQYSTAVTHHERSLAASPLVDQDKFTQALEDVCRDIWRRHCDASTKAGHSQQ